MSERGKEKRNRMRGSGGANMRAGTEVGEVNVKGQWGHGGERFGIQAKSQYSKPNNILIKYSNDRQVFGYVHKRAVLLKIVYSRVSYFVIQTCIEV